jgi:hypothetical protein
MTEIEALTEEEYAYFLAFGDVEDISVHPHQVWDETGR